MVFLLKCVSKSRNLARILSSHFIFIFLLSKMISELLLFVVVVELGIIICGLTEDKTPELTEEMRAKLYS